MLKKKLDGLNFNIKIGSSIKDSIKQNSKHENTICLIIGSLYLIGEVLNLN